MNELREAVWQQAAGMLYPEDLPFVAADALARGVDSPALRFLAGLGKGSDTAEILDSYREVLTELGIALPSSEQAIRRRLRRLAEQLLDGRITSGQLAREMVVDEVWMTKEEADFAYLGCYWQELVDLAAPKQVRAAEADLLAAAKAVLST